MQREGNELPRMNLLRSSGYNSNPIFCFQANAGPLWRASSELFARSVPLKHRSPVER